MTAGRSVKPPSLIDKAISIVKGFDPKKQTGDSYADEATQTGDSPTDVVFLKQVHSEIVVTTTAVQSHDTLHTILLLRGNVCIHYRHGMENNRITAHARPNSRA